MFQKDKYVYKGKDGNKQGHQENHPEDHGKEESFWQKLAKLFYSLAVFNAINKHY